jgi:hypothetical protein
MDDFEYQYYLNTPYAHELRAAIKELQENNDNFRN